MVPFAVGDASEEHAVLAGRADGGYLVLLVVTCLQLVVDVVGVFTPQVARGFEGSFLLLDQEVDRLRGLPLEDHGIVAAALKLGPEVASATRLPPDVGQGRARTYGEATRTVHAGAGHGARSKDEKVLRVEWRGVEISAVVEQFRGQPGAAGPQLQPGQRLQPRRNDAGDVRHAQRAAAEHPVSRWRRAERHLSSSACSTLSILPSASSSET